MGNEVMTGIPVADFEPAAEFYMRLLGRAPDFVSPCIAMACRCVSVVCLRRGWPGGIGDVS